MSTGLHAATGGRAHSGRSVVVLLHGAGGNRTQWATQARHLAARDFDVLAYDLPGHGNSAGPALDTVEGYGEAVLADLGQRGVDSFAVVGHSMGAMIALSLAGSHSDRVEALGLVGAGLQLGVNPALLDATRDEPLTAAAAIIDWGHSTSSHLGGAQAPGQWMDGADMAVLRAEIDAHPGSLFADFTASGSFDGTASAAAVLAPTVVISGSSDMMTPPKIGRAVADAIATSSYVELAGAGHMLMMERPAEVSRSLVALLRS